MIKAAGRPIALVALFLLLFGCTTQPGYNTASLKPKTGFDMQIVQQGRQLVLENGCNDCHTAGYLMATDGIPTERWLTGSNAGMEGPWGTLYPANLRLLLNGMAQDQWLRMAKHVKATPMMPWSKLRQMPAEDLVAIYQFVRYLGPSGGPVPMAKAPD